jgi:hypothetical protein
VGHAGLCAHLVFRLDLELVRGGIRSSGYRQYPLSPPRERLLIHGWGQHPFPCNLSEFCTLGFRGAGAARQVHGGP